MCKIPRHLAHAPARIVRPEPSADSVRWQSIAYRHRNAKVAAVHWFDRDAHPIGANHEEARRADGLPAAAEFRFALTQIANQFRWETGKQVQMTYGSSATLASQIENGAPFQMFLSTDEDFVQRLASKDIAKDSGVLFCPRPRSAVRTERFLTPRLIRSSRISKELSPTAASSTSPSPTRWTRPMVARPPGSSMARVAAPGQASVSPAQGGARLL